MPNTFIASNYLTRQDLENHINSLVGVDTSKNKEAGHQIIGTKEELKKLQLSDTTTIWGVKCVMTDNSTEAELKKKKAWK